MTLHHFLRHAICTVKYSIVVTTFKILVLNMGGGASMGSERGGGSIAPLRLRVHNVKPDTVIITETRVEDRNYSGKGVFRGYKLTQHSSSGRRSGGVMVFVKKRHLGDTWYNSKLQRWTLYHRCL